MHADDAGDSTCGASDRFSAAEFALEHALAGLTRADHERRTALHRIPRRHHDDPAAASTTGIGRADRRRIDLHRPHDHRARADHGVIADPWDRGPAHRTSRRRGSGHSGQGDDPPF